MVNDHFHVRLFRTQNSHKENDVCRCEYIVFYLLYFGTMSWEKTQDKWVLCNTFHLPYLPRAGCMNLYIRREIIQN